jgi:RNA polymerase sigma-70 factor (ECF subfamily)
MKKKRLPPPPTSQILSTTRPIRFTKPVVAETNPRARPVESPTWDDATLDACRRGERPALERVFSVEAPKLERTLSRIVGSRADVEDLVQKTLVIAIRNFPTFRGEASVRTWLTSIAVRTARDHVRRPVRALALVHNPEDPRPNPEVMTDGHRRWDAFQKTLGKLDSKKRIAFVLHVIEGRSMEEVAALTGATRAATKSRVLFARRKLVRLMKNDPHLADLVLEPKEDT